jgi:hypothetical protein
MKFRNIGSLVHNSIAKQIAAQSPTITATQALTANAKALVQPKLRAIFTRTPGLKRIIQFLRRVLHTPARVQHIENLSLAFAQNNDHVLCSLAGIHREIKTLKDNSNSAQLAVKLHPYFDNYGNTFSLQLLTHNLRQSVSEDSTLTSLLYKSTSQLDNIADLFPRSGLFALTALHTKLPASVTILLPNNARDHCLQANVFLNWHNGLIEPQFITLEGVAQCCVNAQLIKLHYEQFSDSIIANTKAHTIIIFVDEDTSNTQAKLDSISSYLRPYSPLYWLECQSGNIFAFKNIPSRHSYPGYLIASTHSDRMLEQ